MNDAFGKKLRIGDEVIHPRHMGSTIRLDKRVVIGFTPSTVRVLPLNAPPTARHTNAAPSSLILYTEDMFTRT